LGFNIDEVQPPFLTEFITECRVTLSGPFHKNLKEEKLGCGSREGKRKAKVVLTFPGVENGSQELQALSKNPGGAV